MLRGKTACENAVAIRKAHMFANDWRIRKPAGAGNGYRVCWMGAFRKYESPVPPLCGDTGLQKRSKVFSGSVCRRRFFALLLAAIQETAANQNHPQSGWFALAL